jgi:LicD family
MAKLTIGMAVYDDYDGVYFTIQSIRLVHAAELDDIEFLILDNHPGGPVSPVLQLLADRVPRCRYVAFGGYSSTAVRDIIFREATTDYVMCVDSHILLQAGAVRALLDYFDARPGCRDIVQGPLLQDSLSGNAGTHYKDEWGGGMWGRWAADPRGQDPLAEPFEIAMQGLGVFACRRDAWTGFNPRMRGHGGEEGYVHEKFRRAGGRVICHPAIRWLHKGFRSTGLLYPASWRDRARNYVLAFGELGWDTSGLEKHLHEILDQEDPEKAEMILEQARAEAASPYARFDAVFCLHRDDLHRRWQRSRRELAVLGIDWLAEPVVAPTRAGALRSIVAAASRRRLDSILILEDDLLPGTEAASVLDRFVCAPEPWSIWRPAQDEMHALAIHRTAYDQVLAATPPAQVESWLEQEVPDTLPPLVADWQLPRVPQWAIDGIYHALAAIDRILSHASIPYTMLAGTLLGAIRHHGMIPWDDDADLGIREQDLQAILAARPLLAEQGFDIKQTEVGLKVFPAGRGAPHVDLFPMMRRNDIWVYAAGRPRRTWPNPNFTDHDLEHLTPRAFGPLNLLCVPSATAHDYLNRAYGPNWRTSVRLKSEKPGRATIESRTMQPEDLAPALPSSWS